MYFKFNKQTISYITKTSFKKYLKPFYIAITFLCFLLIPIISFADLEDDLFESIKANDLEKIRQLLEAGADPQKLRISPMDFLPSLEVSELLLHNPKNNGNSLDPNKFLQLVQNGQRDQLELDDLIELALEADAGYSHIDPNWIEEKQEGSVLFSSFNHFYDPRGFGMSAHSRFEREVSLKAITEKISNLLKAIEVEDNGNHRGAENKRKTDNIAYFKFVCDLLEMSRVWNSDSISLTPSAKFNKDGGIELTEGRGFILIHPFIADIYLAHLTNRSGIVSTVGNFNCVDQAEVFKRIREKNAIDLENWAPCDYLFLHAWSLVSLITRIKNQFINIQLELYSNLSERERDEKRESILRRLIRELAITIETLSNYFEDPKHSLHMCETIAKKIGNLGDDEEYVIASGGNSEKRGAHAVYIVFRRKGSEITIRADNRGLGVKELGHKIQPETGKVYPKVIAVVPVEYFENPHKAIKDYILKIVQSIKPQNKPLLNILKEIYRIDSFDQLDGARAGVKEETISEGKPKRRQRVNNCVVSCWHVGEHIRLGDSLSKFAKRHEKVFATDFHEIWKAVKKDVATSSHADSTSTIACSSSSSNPPPIESVSSHNQTQSPSKRDNPFTLPPSSCSSEEVIQGTPKASEPKKLLQPPPTQKRKFGESEPVNSEALTRDVKIALGILNEFLCPITGEVMRDPVTAADGYNYERSAIESWFNSGHQTSPVTGSLLCELLSDEFSSRLTPNRDLRNTIKTINLQSIRSDIRPKDDRIHVIRYHNGELTISTECTAQRNRRPDIIFLLNMERSSVDPITMLDLQSQDIGPVEAEKLAEILPNMKNLVKLKLAKNHIGSEGCIALFKNLPQTLKSLDLRLNEIANDAALKLAEILPNMKDLVKLKLSGNTIDQETLDVLLKSLPSTLIKLDF